MSCSLLEKNDWLDNNLQSATPKVFFGLTAIIGGSLVVYEYMMENTVCKIETDKSLQLMMKMLQITGIFITLLSIIMLVMTFTSNVSFSGTFLKFGVILTLLAAIFVLALVVGIDIEMTKLKCEFNDQLWIPVGVFLVMALLLAYYTFKSDVSIAIPEQEVDWSQVSSNAALIEKIGQQQARKCGLELDEGESLQTFAYYLKKRRQLFENKTNVFSRLWKKDEPLPKDKIPNIIKMNSEMKENLKTISQLQQFNLKKKTPAPNAKKEQGIIDAAVSSVANIFSPSTSATEATAE